MKTLITILCFVASASMAADNVLGNLAIGTWSRVAYDANNYVLTWTSGAAPSPEIVGYTNCVMRLDFESESECNAGHYADTGYLESNDGTQSVANSRATWTNNPTPCLYFDGDDDSVVVLDHVSLEPTEISITYWLRATVVNGSMVFIQKDFTGGFYFYETSSRLKIYMGGTAASQVPNPTIPTATWQFVAVTHSEIDDRLAVYSNAVQVAWTQTVGPKSYAADPVTVGNRTDGTRPYEGWMDDVRIYNRVLTTGEVTQIWIGNKGTYGL